MTLRKMAMVAVVAGALALPGANGQDQPMVVPVAQAGGGTYPLPLGDPVQMRSLQGLGQFPAPRISIVSPRNFEMLPAGQPVKVVYKMENYDVGQPPTHGQHVHVILDNTPYFADYDHGGTAVFNDVAPGTHTLVIFLSRRFHLSLKNPQAVAKATFFVGGKREPEKIPGPKTPMLVYSRPKATYTQSDGAAANILCDFYLLHCRLSPSGYRVRVSVNGTVDRVVTKWEPFILLTNPPLGKYDIKLELLDAAGALVASPWNSATRTITIDK